MCGVRGGFDVNTVDGTECFDEGLERRADKRWNVDELESTSKGPYRADWKVQGLKARITQYHSFSQLAYASSF